MPDLLSLILTDTRTKSDAAEKLAAVSAYLRSQIFGGEFAGSSFDSDSLSWLSKNKDKIAGGLTKDNLEETLTQAETDLEKIVPILIYLSWEPDKNSQEKIAQMAREKFGGNILLEFKFDSGLIAGPAVSYHGLYKDYSLKAKMQENQSELFRLLK